MKLIKKDLVEQILQDLDVVERGLKKEDIKLTVDKLIYYITDNILNFEAGDGIELRGLGSFTVKKSVRTKGHNPKTMEPLQIDPHLALKFKASVSTRQTLFKKYIKNT